MLYPSGSSPAGDLEETLEEVLRLARPLVDSVPNVLVTLGHHGAALLTQVRSKEWSLQAAVLYCMGGLYHRIVAFVHLGYSTGRRTATMAALLLLTRCAS